MQPDENTDTRNETGAAGELAVREHVSALGWQIVEHNVRWREGELDLIALDGPDLVVAEVKTLRARGSSRRPAFSPLESIGARKQSQIRNLTRRWLVDERRRAQQLRFRGLRFDAFAVVVDEDGSTVTIEHVCDAF